MKPFISSIVATVLLTSLIVAPGRAYAADIVWDLPNSVLQLGTFVSQLGNTLLTGEDFTKEYVLDPIAWIASKQVLQTMTESMINTIVSGNNGGPQYITDLKKHLGNLGDSVAVDFLGQLAADGRIDSPFKTTMLESARENYFRGTASGGYGVTHPYTLKNRCANDAGFLGGESGSFNLSCWMGAIQNPANNPFGAELLATDALLQNVGKEQETRKEELGWGNGFLSKRSGCGADAVATVQGIGSGNGSFDLNQLDRTYKCAIENPGSVLSALTNEFVFSGTGAPAQTNADELSEVLAGLFGNFLGNVLKDGLGGSLGGGSNDGGGTSGGGGVGQNIYGAFLQTIGNQKAHVQPYIDAWKRIQDVANAAKSKLESCNRAGARTALETEVQPVLDKSAAEIARGINALTKLNDLQTRAQSASGSATEFQKLNDEYQALQSGSGTPIVIANGANLPCSTDGPVSVVPSAQDIACVIQQSQDSSGVGTPSLYYKMAVIAGRSCLSYGGE